MLAEGFEPLPSEWWHFDGPGWQDFPLLDVNPYPEPLFPDDGSGPDVVRGHHSEREHENQ